MNIKIINLCQLISIIFLSAGSLISRPPALPNFKFVGNVCYLNAALQSLYSLEPFVNVLNNKETLFKPDTFPGKYVELLTNFKDPLTINPETSISYLESFQRINDTVMQQVAECSANAQNDSHEFLTKLIENLSNPDNFSAPQSEDASFLLTSLESLFFNRQQSVRKCPAFTDLDLPSVDERKNVPYSPIFSIPIQDSPNPVKLENLLENYFSVEILEVFREYPKNVCTKQLELLTTPEILIIHTNRLALGFKIETPIDVPEILNLSPITNHDEEYQLTAVIVHRGDAGGGHYVAYVRDFEDLKWYECNDNSIDLRGDFSAVPEIIKGYMFFYQKLQPGQAPQQPIMRHPLPTPPPSLTPPQAGFFSWENLSKPFRGLGKGRRLVD